MIHFNRRQAILLAGAALFEETITKCGRVWAAESSKRDGWSELTLTQVSAMIRGGKVTSTELTSALLERIAALNPKVNCYVTVTGTEALAQARILDAEQKSGRLRGPLHGIPIALKDNIDTAGIRTTAASHMFRNRVPEEDAEIVRRLKAAGAVIVGKLNMDEFALGCAGDISYFGPARNPWSLDRATGGSSSGSGASVGARLAYGSIGTDSGGSIRVPSAWCGVVGLKPTFGLVSLRGIIPCDGNLDHCGPIARTVEDVALMLGVMVGYDQRDIYSVPSQPEDYVAALAHPVDKLRLSAPQSFYDHIDPESEPVVRAALAQLSKLTAGITSRAPLWDGDSRIPIGAMALYHRGLVEKYGMDYMPAHIRWVSQLASTQPGGEAGSAADEALQQQHLMTARHMIDGAFKDFDRMVVPTTAMAPPKIDDSLKRQMEGMRSDGQSARVYDFFPPGGGCTNSLPFDFLGIPAISVPCGFTAAGLPVGITIAGPHFSEGKILALAYAYQQSAGWYTKTPSLTSETTALPILEDGKPL
jgi:aspartyl-tRNA(Asn)/glutamyl-tRNA(Gln) amidotransferase subunit A